MRVRFSDRALADLARILAWLHERNPQAATALSARIDAVVEQLVEFPYSGPRRYRGGVRMIPIHGVPYVIFDIVEQDEVLIARLRHGARRPLWKDQA